MMKPIALTFISTAFLLMLISTPVFPKTAVGKYAGEFLSLGVGARYLGMGGASVAFVNDVHAGYWNPSGLAKLQYPQIALMHAGTFANIVNYDYASVSFPIMETKTIGISVIRLGISDIANTRSAWDFQSQDVKDNPSQYITFFNATDYAFLLSFAGKTHYNLSYGINLKAIQRQLGSFGSAFGVGFDIGFMLFLNDRFTLGLTLQDITTTFIAWNSGHNELITPTIKTGCSYQIPLYDGNLLISHDVDTRFEGRNTAAQANLGQVSFDFHTGLEYCYRETLSIRTGIDELGRLTLGTGLKLSELHLDYSYSGEELSTDTGESHRISLHLNLKLEKFKR